MAVSRLTADADESREEETDANQASKRIVTILRSASLRIEELICRCSP